MAHLPPVGSILRITNDFDKDKFWYSYQPYEYVIRIPGKMENLEYPDAISCVNVNRITQWLITGCYTIVHTETEGMPWTEQTGIERGVKHLKSFMKDHDLLSMATPDMLPPKKGPVNILMARPRTQKCRGLRVLAQIGHLPGKEMFVYQKPITEKADLPTLTGKIMARPCPSRPRHGFVDSRIIKDMEDLNKAIAETLAHDSHGEVVCMRYIPATYSGLVTNKGITMGKGTDGATAGTSAIHIPCNTDLEYTLSLKDRYLTCINGRKQARSVLCSRYATYNSKKHRLFVETVGDNVVQLRTGPLTGHGIETTHSWSRYSSLRPFTVYTIKGDEDFLEYEKMLEGFAAKPKEVIIYFPTGSLLSHFAVQAIAKGISIVTGQSAKAPKAGQSYAFSVIADTLEYGSAYRKAVLRGLKLAATMPADDETLTWAVSIIQGIGSAPKEIPSVALITAATMLLMRAGTAICLGEYRHFYRKGPGLYKHQALGPLGVPLGYIFTKPEYPAARDEVYKAVLTSYDWTTLDTYHLMQQYLTAAKFDFNHRPWRPSYGGPKWGDCTAATLQVFESMLPIMHMTTQFPSTAVAANNPIFGIETLNNLITASNRLITVSHNSNKCLTKLVSGDTLECITHGQTGLAIACSPYTMKAIK